MTILIAGDSWGCGEWPGIEVESQQPIHQGLAQYIKEDNSNVVNISRGASSNIMIYQSIDSYLSRLSNSDITKIFVFQTEYTRDYPFGREEDWANVTEANSIADCWIDRFYNLLSELAKKYHCKIYLIGGVSDTLATIQQQGLEIACQSMTNLILTGRPNNDFQPVLSWYTSNDSVFVERLKSVLPNNKLEHLINLIDIGYERENILWNNPEYFYPDGAHPNRKGHKILFDYLKSQGYLD